MAERGQTGPFFYHGYFGHPSVTTEMTTLEQRNEWRRHYKRLMLSFGKNSYQSKMKARVIMRSIMYPALNIKDRTR